MEKNCYVKKYKVSVIDENLPVLETMQQFTLNAITASGNNSMTDAQKWALNHFFYELGVFNEDANSIWNKLESVVMPILAVDKLNGHYAIDYKDNTAYAYGAHYQYIGFSENGLYSTHTGPVCSFKKTITGVDIKNIAIFQLNAGHTKQNANQVCITTSDNLYGNYDISLAKGGIDSQGTQLVGIMKNGTYGYRHGNTVPSDLTAISLNGVDGITDQNSCLYGINEGEIVNYPLSIYQFNDFTAESASLLNIVNQTSTINPLQMTIVGKNLNSTETLKLAKAIYEFREAYLG